MIETECHEGKTLLEVKGSLSSNLGSNTCCCVTQEDSLYLSELHLQNRITDNSLTICKV